MGEFQYFISDEIAENRLIFRNISGVFVNKRKGEEKWEKFSILQPKKLRKKVG